MDEFETTTALYCHHHKTMGGVPTYVMPAIGVTGNVPETNKRDADALVRAGIATVMWNKKKGKGVWRDTLTLPKFRILRRKIFEIHCYEGCEMLHVIQNLATGYIGKEMRLRVTSIRPDEGYAWLHYEDYAIRPERIDVIVYRQVERNILFPSDKIKKRGRRLYSVMCL